MAMTGMQVLICHASFCGNLYGLVCLNAPTMHMCEMRAWVWGIAAKFGAIKSEHGAGFGHQNSDSARRANSRNSLAPNLQDAATQPQSAAASAESLPTEHGIALWQAQQLLLGLLAGEA